MAWIIMRHWQEEKFPKGRCAAGRNRGSRRTGIRVSDIYRCCSGVRDQDRAGRDPAGRVRERMQTLVITGEGRMDGQTAMGKAPVGVAGLAKKYGKPVTRICRGSRSGCQKNAMNMASMHFSRSCEVWLRWKRP